MKFSDLLQAYQESQLSQSSEKSTKLEEAQTELENEILHLRKEKLEADSVLKKWVILNIMTFCY